jgi:hypothetical protein
MSIHSILLTHFPDIELSTTDIIRTMASKRRIVLQVYHNLYHPFYEIQILTYYKVFPTVSSNTIFICDKCLKSAKRKIGKQEFRRTDFDSRLLAAEGEGSGGGQ